MRKNIVKRMLSCLLATALLTSVFTGCGSEGKQNESKESISSSNVETSTDVKETDVKETEESTEPVKISILPAGFGDGFVEESLSGQWQKIIEEKCNVEIEWVIPPSSAYEDHLQLTLLDDEKPDVICFSNGWMSNTSFLDACKTGMFTDISGLIENYPNLMKWTSELSWEALDLFQDGRIWGFPRSTVARADGWLVKEQWLEAIGSDLKEGETITLDEFYDILYKFTYNDPDGNGINDTYGIGGYESNGVLFTGIDRIFHVGGWYDLGDGKIDSVKYSKDYDYYKQYLEFMNKCWEAGLIEPDAYALDSKAATERRKTSYGMWAEYPASMDILVEEGENPVHTEIFLPGVVVEGDPIGEYGYGEYSNNIWNFYAISSTCEHPEKVLEMVDYMLSDEQWVNLNAQSLEGVGFTMDAEGNYDFTMQNEIKAADKANGTNLAHNSFITKFVRRAGAAEFFVKKSYTAAEQKRLSDLIQLTFENYWPTLDRAYVPEIAKDQAFMEYESYIKQEEAKIITGEKPVEYWDELLDGFYEAGYDKYRTEMLEYIASFE